MTRTLRTHVEFRSAKFPPFDDETAEVNPGRFGKRLADYLTAELPARGVVTGEVFAEDWGWIVRIENVPFKVWIGCANYDEYSDGFLCFIEPSKPVIRRWLRMIDTTLVVSTVADALDMLLQNDPEIWDVRWWSEDEVM